MTLGYLGTIPSTYPINAVYQWMRGPEDAVMWVALKPDSGIRIEHFKEELRGELAAAMPDVQFSFEPADIINQVMSFGSSTPVEVAVSGPDFAQTRPYAAKVQAELAAIPGLRDLHVVQSLDYPIDPSGCRSPQGGDGLRHADRRVPLVGRGHLLQPLHGAELLGRSQERHRLSGASGSAAPGGPHAAGDRADRLDRRSGDGSGQTQRRRARSSCATWPPSPPEPCPAKSTATTCGGR